MRSNEELQQFAYVASHDLQEPLRTVSIYAQLLAKRYRGQLAGDADQFIKFIVEGSERMEKLIHDLLDFSRVDARGADFFTRMSCDEALDDAIGNLHSLIEESGAVITREALPTVTGDPVQLTRLFQNLLVNSIKYRTEEAPHIHIAARATGPGVALFRAAITASASSRSMRRRSSASSSACIHATAVPAAAWAWQSAARS